MEQFDQYIDDCLEVLLTRRADASAQRRREEAMTVITPRAAPEIGRLMAAATPPEPEPPDPPEVSDHDRRNRWLYGSAIPPIRGLPTHLSGLGISRYAGIAGKMARVRSRALTEQFIRNHYTLASLRYGTSAWPALGTSETIHK